MKNIQILDCTLRDGGRIIDCKFDDSTIVNMARDLNRAGIDIIEMGFLRDRQLVEYKGNSTFFTETKQIEPFIPKERGGSTYVAFIDFNMYDFVKLEACDGNSITGIRVGFTKKDFDTQKEELKRALLHVKAQGYTLFAQGVNSLAYTDRELLDLIDMMNEVEPYSYGIVDTYGAMYLDDILHFYNLIDYNLHPDICVDIHSHNNFQLSFAFAQEVIRLADGRRNIILDATLNGMGKCAGNLTTELIVDYLVRKKNRDYDIDKILDTIDKYLVPLQEFCTWGYSIPAFMAGCYKAHPNNVIYLTEKYRLNSKDIKYILSGIEESVRQRYDYDNIQRVYRDYNKSLIDDEKTLQALREELQGKSILILAPGKTIEDHYGEIFAYAEADDPVIISVNFIPKQFSCNYYFYANTMHWERVCDDVSHTNCIVTSNIHVNTSGARLVDYASLIVEDSPLCDNSTIMLLNLLKKLDVSKICIAGFDGLKVAGENYVSAAFPNTRKEMSVDATNKEVKKLYEQYRGKVAGKIEVRILTPSVYERQQ